MRYLSHKNACKNKSRGFTILETLVAISILVLALTAPLAIVAQALRSSYYARDQVTAYFLAQEAVEFLRNKRDIAGLQSSVTAEEWTDLFRADIDVSIPNSGTPFINTAGSTNLKAYLVRDSINGYMLKSCGTTCPEIRYDAAASNGVLYGDISGGSPSIFTREIIISEPVSGVGTQNENDIAIPPAPARPPKLRELVINVRVRWRMANGDLSDGVTIREHLTNWQLEKTPPVTP